MYFSGHNILRKAKLQLNRAALNKSKAELARTLKKEMRREAKLETIHLKKVGGKGDYQIGFKSDDMTSFSGLAQQASESYDFESPSPKRKSKSCDF